MPSLRPLRWFLLAAAAGLLPAQSQSPRGTRPLPHAVQKGAFAGVNEHQGALLGTAHGYRARFGERGLEYLPALGKHAPKKEPFGIALQSVRRGDEVLLTAAAAADPLRTHDRCHVAYAWPGMAERYETKPEGLEQSFVFAERPRGRGDLVVHLAVATALPRATDGALAWRNERGGGVRIGDVTGIDATGARCRGTARFADGGYELALPAAFVDAATYPLVLDPLIATAIEAYPGADCDFPDVAYDDYSQSYCVVWTQFFGGGSTAVIGSVFDAQSLGLAYAFGINSGGDQDSGRVCLINGTGVYVIVWVDYTASGASIAGIAFEPSQAAATSVWSVWGPGYVESPILSGEATIYDDDCLLAWIDGTYGLIGTTIAVDPNLQVSATPLVQLAGGNVTEPAFSKQGGNPGIHVLTWVDRPTGLPGWVRAQVVDNDLNVLGPGVWLDNGTQDCGHPAVDGDGFRFLVAWERQEVGNPSSFDVHGRLITVGPTGVTSVGSPQALVAYPNDLDYAVDVAMLGDKFGIVYMAGTPSAPYHDDCYVQVRAADGSPIGGELRLDLTGGPAYVYEHTPRLIGHRAGDPGTGSDEGLVVFADQSIQTADSNVGLQLVEAMGSGGGVVDRGGGCGPGGLAAANGPFALGNTQFQCELFGAQPLAVPFLLFAVAAPPQSCGVCSYLQPLGAQFVANTAGHAAATWSLPGDPGLVGVAFDFQFVSFNVAYVGCPVAPGVAGSNILRATLDY